MWQSVPWREPQDSFGAVTRDAMVGTTLAGYTLLDRVGEGGTATESNTVVEFTMGGAVVGTQTHDLTADGFGRRECN